MISRNAAYALFLAALGACGGSSVTASSQRLTDAQSAIRAANEAGASGYPDAALHLAIANEQFQRGDRLLRDGKEHEASLAFQRAKADGELAVALVHQARARQSRDQAGEDLNDFQQGAPHQGHAP